MSIFSSIVEGIKSLGRQIAGTQTSLRAEVGEGLTPEQKARAEEVIRKPAPKVLPGTGIVGAIESFKQDQGSSISLDQAMGPGIAKSKDPIAQKARTDAMLAVAGSVSPLKFLNNNLGKKAGEKLAESTTPAIKEALMPVIRTDADELSKAVTYREGKPFVDSINLEKITTTEDVQNIIKNTALDKKLMIDEQRRGKITHEMTKKMADDLGMTVDELVKNHPGTAFNAEELVASRDLLKTYSNKVDELSKKIQAGDKSDETLTQFRTAFNQQAEIQRVIAGVATEQGRGLSALKISARDLPIEERAQRAIIDAMGGREFNQEIADRLSKIPLDDKVAVTKFIRDISPSSAYDKVYEYWINSILSGTGTHGANVIGNSFMALLRPVVRAGEAVAELRKGAGREVFFGEIPEQMVGMVKGIKEGVKKGLSVLKNGITFDDVSRVDISKLGAIKGTKGEIIRTPTNLLGAADEFFKAVNRTAEMGAQAYRQALKEGLKGADRVKRMQEILAHPDDAFMKNIEKMTLQAVFQKPLGKEGGTILGQFGEKASGFKELPIMKYVIPFIKTPINVLDEAIAFSPLGLGKAARTIKNQGVGSTQLSTDVAKTAIGSLVSARLMTDVLEGNITGSEPKNDAERDAFYREGKQPYSIRVGDHWVSYKRIEPLATLFSTVADAKNLIDNGEDVSSTAGSVFSLLGKNMKEKSFVTGLSNVMDAIDDPQTYGTRFITQTLAGFVPSIVNDVRNAFDPVVRNTKGDSFAEMLELGIKNRIPGISKSLTPKRNVFGEEITSARQGLEAFSPIAVEEVGEPDALDTELGRLGVMIGLPGKSQMKTKLSQEQYDKFLASSGTTIKTILSDLIQTSDYEQATDAEREKMIDNTVDKIRKKVQSGMAGEILLKKQGVEIPNENLKKAFNAYMEDALVSKAWKQLKNDEDKEKFVREAYGKMLVTYGAQ